MEHQLFKLVFGGLSVVPRYGDVDVGGEHVRLYVVQLVKYSFCYRYGVGALFLSYGYGYRWELVAVLLQELFTYSLVFGVGAEAYENVVGRVSRRVNYRGYVF